MNNEQNKILNVAALLFVGIALLVMLLQNIAGPGYKASNSEILAKATNPERWLLPYQYLDLIESDQLQNYLLVDLRTREEFNQGSLPGAINIPFDKLLEKSSLKQLKSRKPVILFSATEARSSVAGLLLNGKGLKKVQVLANNYEFMRDHVLAGYKPSVAFTHAEKARYDFRRYFKAAARPASEPAGSKPKIIQTEVIVAGGGC